MLALRSTLRRRATPRRDRDRGHVGFFQEVDEEVRREKAELFWKKHQNLVIGVALAIVTATAGYRFHQFYQQRQSEEAGAVYETAISLVREGRRRRPRKASSSRRQSPGRL
ncbi:MAG: tetratricopeptide repeat protein [Rhodoblastus sp.]|nr:MAG: tetratricopeptide repeat protein [Rhodoblastus sp.]